MRRFNLGALLALALGVTLLVEPGRAADSSFNAAMPANGQAVGAKRTTDGKMVPLQVDGTGALVTSGGGSGSNASVGTNGVAAPTSSTQVGWRDGGGVLQPVSAANPLPVSASVTPASAAISTGNSTTTPLGAGGVFLGTAVDTLAYAAIAYSIQSDVISAVGGIQREWSQDGVNWFYFAQDSLASDRIGANNGTDLAVRPHSRYFRIRYTNGGTPQGFFRLQTILYPTIPQGDTIGVDHAPLSGDDALLTKSVMTGKTTAGGGTYVDVKVNPSGALTVETTGTVTANQGTPAATANRWPVQLSDGVNLVGVAASGGNFILRTGIFDAVGNDLEFAKENDNFNAADHGILMLGRDVDSNPDKYRVFRLDTNGSLYVVGAGANNADGEAAKASGVLETEAYTMGWNGLTWDRIVTHGTGADAEGTRTTGAVETDAHLRLWNGATFDRARGTIANGMAVDVTRVQGNVAARLSKAAAAPLSTAVSVTTTATLLPASALASRTSLCVYNNGAATIFLGTSGVTTATGFPLPAGGAFCDDVGAQPYYGIVATGTVDARVLEN